MSGIIDLRDPNDPVQALIQQLMHEKQLKLEKERIGIQKKDYEQRAAEFQLAQQQEQARQRQQAMENAQKQAPQFAAEQSIQQTAAPLLQQIMANVAGAGASGGAPMQAQAPTEDQQAAIQYAQLGQQPGVDRNTQLAAAPTYAAKIEQIRLDKRVRDIHTPAEYAGIQNYEAMYAHAKAAGLSDAAAQEQADPFLAPGSKRQIEIAKAKADLDATTNLRASQITAQQHAKAMGYDVTPEQAPEFISNLYQQNRLFKQQRDLALLHEGREDTRAQQNRAATSANALRTDLRQSFESNPLVADSRGIAGLVAAAQKVAAQRTGAGDLALADLAVRATILGTGARGVPQAQFKTALKTQSLGMKLAVLLPGGGHWTQGSMLTDGARARLLETIHEEARAKKAQYNQFVQDFTEQAKNAGMDANTLIIDPWKKVVLPPTAEERKRAALGR